MSPYNNSYKIIYHADDDEDDRMLFMDAVSELDLEINVKQAEDGQKLLDILCRNPMEIPEIVFLDINMPGLSGFECLEQLRKKDGQLGAVKVVMLSTSGTPENISRSFELGADLYAVKPSTFSEFKELLGGILAMDWKAGQINKSRVYSSLTWML